MTDQTIARTILMQLGFRQFIALTGSKDFLAGEDYLQFTIRGNPKNKANKCRITLNGLDLYDMTFYRYNNKTGACPEVDSASDVYAEDLQDIFTHHTGLDTHL